MFEKVNPSHPDKVADRIAGSIVDLAYKVSNNPHIAVEVLIGHKVCNIIIESDVEINEFDIISNVIRISETPGIKVNILHHPQDKILNKNQSLKPRCGDNGIFKGVPVTKEEMYLTEVAKNIYSKFSSDGKYIVDKDKLIICQSGFSTMELRSIYPSAIINPLGDWIGGLDSDTGATNRKLGSDMGNSVTGGGLCGKDVSKGDVSINIYAWLKAQELGKEVNLSCAIGDDYIDGKPYSYITDLALNYINSLGGFEKFSEWGLLR